ncbi:hypothetical protein CR513_36202, partial [Mucuna pruriens]
MAKLLRISKAKEWPRRHPEGQPRGQTRPTPARGRFASLHGHYVDLAAIDTFLTEKDRGENLVIAILANTYYSLNYFYERNGKGLRCCTSLLYLWLMPTFSTTKEEQLSP